MFRCRCFAAGMTLALALTACSSPQSPRRMLVRPIVHEEHGSVTEHERYEDAKLEQEWGEVEPYLDVQVTPETDDDVLLLTVHGEFEAERFAGLSPCGSPSLPVVKSDEREILFYNEWFDSEAVERLVISMIFDGSACGTSATEILTGAQDDARHFIVRYPPLGQLALRFEDDDRVTVYSHQGERTLAPGEAFELTISGQDQDDLAATGSLLVVHRGFWPRSGMILEQQQFSAERLVEAGLEAQRMGRRARAHELFTRAIRYDPRSAPAHMALSDLYFVMRSTGEAVHHAERAVELDPERGEYLLGLGDAYYIAKRYDDALDAYERAHEYGIAKSEARMAKTRGKLDRAP